MSYRLLVSCFAAVSVWGQSHGFVPIKGRDTLSDEEFFNQNTFELREQSPAATVSAERLRHPVTQKAAKMLDRALAYSVAGEHAKAIEQLRRALKEPSAIPYAHSMLGAEYLWTKEVPAAIGELEEAIRLLPHEAANHSNLGYALYLEGQVDRGREEVHQALALDANNPKTRFVLGIIERK